MISDDNRLPKTLAGLFGVAGALFWRRAPLYFTLAAAAIVVQFVVGVLLPRDDGLVTGLMIVVDAFFMAAVSIGVAFDLADKPADWSTVLIRASERWGVVATVSLVDWIMVMLLWPSVFSSTPDDSFYGLLILPVFLIWGALALAVVVAAIEPVKTQLSLPFLALGKGLAVGFRWPNIGRLLIVSIVAVIPSAAISVLAAVFTQHHVPQPLFWSSVPLDALTVGPIQALLTVFYVDFLRRARG